MRQEDIIRILRDHGPMSGPDIARHDTSGITWASKVVCVYNRLRILERQKVVRRMGWTVDDKGHSAIIWELEP